ncbi:MAG: peptidoglycan bridge formation glycyltransferase FemA/FemB family protein [Arcobacteraceae bacterium]|nr:peptidoglycan bridge formation glycyltransferase FemA/FemB family protein [Arcobacteraceae bacterium]
MVSFTLINDRKIWNDEIVKYPNYNPYQVYEWGEYKKNIGWNVVSIKANKNGHIAYLQITYKIKLNIFLGWCVGSIVGDISAFNKNEFIEYLQKKFNIKYVFIKSSFTNTLDVNESISLYTSGWSKTSKKLTSDYTVYVDLNQSIENLLEACSNNFRKNVKRGINKNLSVEVKELSQYSENEISELFHRFKMIKDVPLPSLEELTFIKKNLSKNIIIATSSIDDQIVGLRAFLFIGNKALDFWATTDLVGRKNYTSYMLLFELFKKAKEMNIQEYDMSGIDPLNNPNVYSFKNGIRAQTVEKLGEWELSNSKLISFLINKVYL